MIRQLVNPKTELYLELKKYVLSSEFPFYYQNNSTTFNSKNHVNIPLYVHTLIKRPDEANNYPKINSPNTDGACEVVSQLLKHNNIKIVTYLRMVINCIHPQEKLMKSVPHFDHHFKHKNIIIYLTGAGGNTIVEGEVHEPQEDDVIIFEGEHYHQTPVSGRRVVLVATFIDEEML